MFEFNSVADIVFNEGNIKAYKYDSVRLSARLMP